MGAGIQNSRFVENMKRLFGLKDSVSPEVAGDILSVADTYDVQAAESYRLRGEALWILGVTSINGVGVANRVQIGFDPSAPPARGSVISIIDEIHAVGVVGNFAIQMGITPNLNLTVPGGAVRYRDARAFAPANVIPAFGFTQVTADSPGLGTLNTTMGQWQLAGTAEQILRAGIVLVPGTRFELGVNAGSVTIEYLFLGRERALDPSEVF
jgi:hypothetical protein